jgi:CRISPR-associated protein Csb2
MSPFTLHVHYLTGRCVATAYNDRDRAEWPPHPARVFSALAATWADSETPDPAERAALDWLAGLLPPSLVASAAARRQVVPYFVPVNDTKVLDPYDRQREKLAELEQAFAHAKDEYAQASLARDAKTTASLAKALDKFEKSVGAERKKLEKGLLENQAPNAPGKNSKEGLENAWALIPEHRGKQPRTFPSVTPDDPNVYLRWEAAAPDIATHKPALAALAARVVRIGHSASLVTCRVTDACPNPTWTPNASGEEVLRVTDREQMLRLEAAYARHREIEPRVLPCRFQRYAQQRNACVETTAMSSFADDWIVFRHASGKRLSQTCGVEIARAMRGALMSHGIQPPPELLSGHGHDGQPSQRPHLAIVPLPFVGSRYATGEILGVALVFPRDADETQRQIVLRSVGLWEQQRRRDEDDDLVDTPPLDLTLGRAGMLTLERIEWGVSPLKTLRPSTWCRASTSWVTATPIALDRNPGELRAQDPTKQQQAFEAAEQIIAAACERIGLPRPSNVQLHPSVPLVGVAKARAYPAFPADPNKMQRVKAHARIEFPVPVHGPVLLGAGRYHGLGLCFPMQSAGRAEP